MLKSSEPEKFFNPWLACGSIDVPIWLMLRTELSFNAKLYLALILAESEESEPNTICLYELAAKYGAFPKDTEAAIQELREQSILSSNNGAEDVYVPPEWCDPTFTLGEEGEPIYAQHPPGQWWQDYDDPTGEGREEGDEA